MSENADAITSPPVSAVTAQVAAAIAGLDAAYTAYGNQPDLAATADLRAAAAGVAVFLPGYDVATGTLPWEREDDEFYTDVDLPGWTASGVDAVYGVYQLDNSSLTVSRRASRYVALADHVTSLVTFHPDYSYDTGEIETPGD